MNAHAVPNLVPALPEILLAVAAMAFLMLGAFRRQESTRLISWLSVAVLALALVMVLAPPGGRVETFGGMFVTDRFTAFMKALVLLGSALAIVMSLGYLRAERMERFEYPVLIVLATLGMLMMVSANDLIALYLGVELQSLALYVVAAFKRDSRRSTEAGLKYFVLGALSSGMLLYGCSLIYGFTGTTDFTVLAESLSADPAQASLGLVAGIAFLTAGLAFKVAAVPFHMWTPDVYEGAPTPITAFFAVAPKIAAMALFVRALVVPFIDLSWAWEPFIIPVSIASMVLGSFAAIGQTNIKRLMAYSSIGHVGYALIGLAAGSAEGIRGVLIYMAIYLPMNVGAFACILLMRRKTGMVEDIDELAGLSRNSPMIALMLAIFMFSLAGVPPLAGFFGKFYVFLAAVDAGLYTLAVVGVLASVVGAFYYVRIVKLMYFDEPAEPFERPIGGEMGLIIAATGLFNLFFFIYPAPIVAGAQAAAAALLP